MIYEIKLKAIEPVNGYNVGETVIIQNDIFNRSNGICFFPIDERFEIVYTRPLVWSHKGLDIFESDKVLVKGRKSIGDYETVVIKTRQGYSLERNDTYLNNDSCFVAIIKKLGNIYE